MQGRATSDKATERRRPSHFTRSGAGASESLRLERLSIATLPQDALQKEQESCCTEKRRPNPDELGRAGRIAIPVFSLIQVDGFRLGRSAFSRVEIDCKAQCVT